MEHLLHAAAGGYVEFVVSFPLRFAGDILTDIFSRSDLEDIFKTTKVEVHVCGCPQNKILEDESLFWLVPLTQQREPLEMDQLMRNCFEDKTIDGATCEHCQQKKTARTRIIHPPELLFIQLQRSIYDRQVQQPVKIKTGVSLQETLSLDRNWFYSPGPSEERIDVEYELCSTIFHLGSSANEGHYMAAVKDHGRDWTLTNDHQVKQGFGFDRVLKQSKHGEVFILAYRRKPMKPDYYMEIDDVQPDRKKGEAESRSKRSDRSESPTETPPDEPIWYQETKDGDKMKVERDSLGSERDTISIGYFDQNNEAWMKEYKATGRLRRSKATVPRVTRSTRVTKVIETKVAEEKGQRGRGGRGGRGGRRGRRGRK